MTNIVHFDPSRLTRFGWILHVSTTVLFVAFLFCVGMSAPKTLTIVVCGSFFFVLILTKLLDTIGDAVHSPIVWTPTPSRGAPGDNGHKGDQSGI